MARRSGSRTGSGFKSTADSTDQVAAAAHDRYYERNNGNHHRGWPRHQSTDGKSNLGHTALQNELVWVTAVKILSATSAYASAGTSEDK
jgi:hypothetical protein